MRTRTRNAIAVGVSMAALGAGLWGLSRYREGGAPPPIEIPPRISVLDAIPDGAMLLLTADLEAVRKSELGRPLLGRRREIPGLGRVDDVCGFDPLDSLTHLAVGIPSAGQDGDFGLVGVGTVAAEPLARCASQVIAARGGQPVETTIGTFRTVRDVALPEQGGEIAVRPGGPVLLGAGAYLRAMIDATEGRTAGVRASAVHERLRRPLGAASVVVSFVFTAEQRRTIASELEAAAAPAPPLAQVVGVGMSLAEQDATIALRAVVVCDDDAACTALAAALTKAVQERASDLGVRLVGLAPALERATIRARADELHLSLDLSVAEADTIIERLTRLGAAAREPGVAPSGPVVPDPSPAPGPLPAPAPSP